jgi:HK97 gp10 family phage protein
MATPVRALRINANRGGGTSNTGIRLEGDVALFNLLNELPDRLARNALRGAPNAAAQMVRDEIRINARARFPNSRLYRAIKNRRASSEGDDSRAFVFVEHGSGSTYDAYFWHFLEYGTVKMSAKPFVRPGIDNSRGKVGAVMADYVRKRFDPAARKGQV